MIFTCLVTLFIAIPILELVVLLKVHQGFGLGNTIVIVVLTGIVGATLARAQGIMVMTLIRRDLAEGKMPAPRLMDGVMILIAGVLLITPGLITDSVGFLLLLPPVRAFIRAWLRKTLEDKLRNGSVNITSGR